MVHLRIVAVGGKRDAVLEVLERSGSVCNVILLDGAARKPAGDLILCDVAREDASVIVEELRELEIQREGSIALDYVDSQISDAAERAEKHAPGMPSDAVVWEDVESRTQELTELSLSYVAFMVLAMMIAAVAIVIDQPILVVGAMVVGPEFGPLAGICVAVVERRKDLVKRSLTALTAGFLIGGVVTILFSLFLNAVGLVPSEFVPQDHPLTSFIARPDWFSAIVALMAGAVGVLSLTNPKSSALIGVLISVTTVPAAAYAALTGALGEWDETAGAAAQLGLNVVAILAAGVLTLAIQRSDYRQRRARHRREINSKASS